jgi:LCP family protein required for cell wall assembly
VFTLRHPRHGVRVGLRALVASLSLLMLVGSGVAWATFKNFSASIPHGAPVPALLAGEKDPDGGDQNILLIGNDTRAGATPAEMKALHVGSDQTTVNADTMMVLHVPANGSRPTVVSFPRDSWVTIPGHGVGKINSAYPDGYNAVKDKGGSEQAAESAGIILTIQTIHALTGLYINHYMQVNLLGFYRISNAIGGVTVCLNAAQNKTTDKDAYGSGYSGIDLPKGVSVIKGAQALAFVRQRHGLPNGDLDRIKRQQYFLRSAFDKISTAGTLLNPFKLHRLLEAIGSSLLTDPSLNLLSLAGQLTDLSAGKVNFATIPNNGATTIYPDGVTTSIVQVDRAAIPAFIQQMEGKGDAAYAKAKAANPKLVTVDVLNGTTTERLAARNAAALQKLGFKINTVDSASATTKTIVEYPGGQEAGAKALLAAVPGAKVIESPEVQRPTLVLGSNGVLVEGLARPAAKTATSAVASTTPAPSAGQSTAEAKLMKETDGLGCIN